MALRRIPVVDARSAPYPAAFAARALPEDIARIIALARRRYTAAGLAMGDALSRRWLSANASPLAAEIEAVAAVVGQPGVHLLNLSYEWACTCGVEATGAPVLLRVLDWDLAGLGETLSVIRQRGSAGDWLHIGWPGLAGAITGFAPGRFAVAINQPPLPLTKIGAAAREHGLALPGLLADWAAARPAAWRSRALPPAHLLRIVCDTAPDFETALAMLRDTPLAASVAFTLAGIRPGEAAAIERTRDRHAVRRGARVAVANHWADLADPGAPRWRESGPRMASMAALLEEGVPASVTAGLDWLVPPLLNEGTRLAGVMRPAEGHLTLAGFEGERRVSEVLDLAA
jgi:hypothetical protein